MLLRSIVKSVRSCEVKYKMPLGKLMCWVCMAFFVFVLVLLTLEDDTREALMVTPLWFVLLGAGWLFAGKNVWRNKRKF